MFLNPHAALCLASVPEFLPYNFILKVFKSETLAEVELTLLGLK